MDIGLFKWKCISLTLKTLAPINTVFDAGYLRNSLHVFKVNLSAMS